MQNYGIGMLKRQLHIFFIEKKINKIIIQKVSFDKPLIISSLDVATGI